jgi:tetratricopeptide (TPR) repeat protein
LTHEALELSKEFGDTESIATCSHNIGRELAEAGFFREAMPYAAEAFKFSKELPSPRDSVLMAASMRVYSIAYRGLEMYDSATWFINEAVKLAPASITCGYMAGTYNDLGQLYLQMGNQGASMSAFKDAYLIIKNCPEGRSASLASYARILAYAYMTGGNYRLALSHFREVDSIYGAIIMKSGKNKVYHAQQASNIARVYQHWGKLDSALFYRQLALKRFTDYGITELNMNVPNQYCYIGTIYREQGDFKQAKEYFEKSLELRKRIADSLGVGMCLDEMAEMERLKGNYLQAINMLQESLQWKYTFSAGKIDPRRRAQYIESRSETYLILGKVFSDWDKYGDAFLYYDSAWQLCENIFYNRGKSIIEYYRGMAFQHAGNPDSALWHYRRSQSLAHEIDNRPLMAKAKEGLGLLYFREGQYELARNELETALAIYLDDGFTRELPGIYLQMGHVYAKIGETENALAAYNKSYANASSMGMLHIQSDAALSMAGIYEKQGNSAGANQYLNEYILLHDSVFSLEAHRQLAEMQALHEYQQQQLQITQLGQENELNMLRAARSQYVIISLGGILIIILLFAILFIRQIRIRNEQKTLINQQQLFRSQMNPHFIFNSLTNIQHYIFSKDSLSAAKYLAIFAKLMRGILNNSRKELISLRDEISTIEQYLELQQLRLEDKLEYILEVDNNLDTELSEIPPMLAQPFIENAIEHGIRNKKYGGIVVVRINKENGYILYEVEDNGVGREKASKIKSDKPQDHESMAVTLTRTRLQNLWGRKKPGKVFEIIDLRDDKGNPSGTLVRFKVPGF